MSTGARRLAGLGLIVGIALAVVLGITKPNPFKEQHRYWAVFDTAHGLGAIDRDVRIAGVKVGQVGAVERVGDNVRVQLNLSQRYSLHTDARAAMRPHTLFEGSNYVDLAPGSPDAPSLAEGGTIPLEQTTNYVTLDRALRVLRPEIRGDLRQLAKVGALTLRGKAISGLQTTLKNGPALSAALAPAARAAEGPHRRELVAAMHGLARTVDALATNRDELIPLTRRLNGTTAALAVDGGAPLDAGLAALPGAIEALNNDAPSLQAVLERLATLSSRLGVSGPRAIARALRAATPVLTRARPALRSGTDLVHGARLIASRLAKAKGGLVDMFNIIGDALETFHPTLDALDSQTSLGASSGAFQLVAGAFEGGDGALRAYQTATQNPGAPGHSLRINGYINPQAGPGLRALFGAGGGLPLLRPGARPTVSCSAVAQVSPRAVGAVRANGGCR